MPKFERGQSGNPTGRPPGSKNVQTELRAELEGHGTGILSKLVERAEAGESVTGRYLLNRILPAARSAPIRIPFQLEGNPTQQAEQVKQKFAEGLLTAEEAQALLDTIHTVELIKVASELPEKLRQLEEKVWFWDEVRQKFQTSRANWESSQARLKAVDRAVAAQCEELMPQFHDDLETEIKAQPPDIAKAGLRRLSQAWTKWQVAGMLLQYSGVTMGVLLQRVGEVAPEAAEAVARRWGLDWERPETVQPADASPEQGLNGVGSDAAGI
jgi:hypothetical protein